MKNGDEQMLPFTHKLIADKVYEAIYEEFHIRVDIEGLKNGSVEPDKYPKKLFMKHKMKVSFHFIKEKIDEISGMEFPLSKEDVERFSFNLGIIIHFISDYFCQAHNDKIYNNIIKHLLYETNLEKYFLRRINTFNPKFENKKTGWNCEKGSISGYIAKKHTEYNSLKRTMTNDLVFSVSMSVIVALRIVSCCLENSSVKFINATA